jgi:tetratricopeptide (TPR) repeat protein
LKTGVPTPEDVSEQLVRMYGSRFFRGAKLRRLLGFLVDQWLADGGARLTLNYIGETLGDEPLTFEEDSDRWGYPKTRANLAHVRKRVRNYFETDGYREQVIIKLNPGSYVPVIAYNPLTTTIPEIEPDVARLILRAKTAMDIRTLRAARRALGYYLQIPLNVGNPRQMANVIFIPMAAASIVPSAAHAIEPFVETLIARIKQLGAEPWESIFTEACAQACYLHEWEKALDLFELSITTSQGESTYFWWYTALLASLGRVQQAISILDSAVHHFSRTNIAVRTDLALLQIMAGRFVEAEEHLSASRDFALADNPLIACHFALLYEAQDRLEDAVAPLAKLLRPDSPSASDGGAPEETTGYGEGAIYLNGLFALILGRAGATRIASDMLEVLLACKASRPASSSVEVALAFVGLGRLDEAAEWLEIAAFKEHDPVAMWFHIFPPLRHLHAHPPFRELLSRLHLSVPLRS